MAEPDTLTLAFLETHPYDAARELERLPATQAAALFIELPARVVAPVLQGMLPPRAAECVAALTPDQAALLLGALNATGAAAVLRHVSAEQRKRLLDALPTAAALACRALLRYPEDAVGALTNVGVVARTADATVDDALQALRDAPAPADRVYVVGNEQRLLGVVEVGALLRAPAQMRIAELLQPAPSLPALMPAASAIDAEAFATVAEVAVVEHGGRLLGAVSLAQLRRGGRRAAPAGVQASALELLAHGYWRAVSALSEAAVEALQPARSSSR